MDAKELGEWTERCRSWQPLGAGPVPEAELVAFRNLPPKSRLALWGRIGAAEVGRWRRDDCNVIAFSHADVSLSLYDSEFIQAQSRPITNGFRSKCGRKGPEWTQVLGTTQTGVPTNSCQHK